MASRIFLQTHIWPMLWREGQVREIRLQILSHAGKQVPVFVNCQQSTLETIETFTWILFVTVERSGYEQALLESTKRAEAMSNDLAKSEKFIRTIADAMPSLITYWDTQLLCQFANQAFLDWFSLTTNEMKGLPMPTVFGQKLFEQTLPQVQGALLGERQEFERTVKRQDGTVAHLLASFIPDIDTDVQGTVKGFFALTNNITRLREADVAIRLSASVFEAATDGIVVTDTFATIASVNSSFAKLTGYSAKDLIGKNADILNSGRHEATFFTTMLQALVTSKLWTGEVWGKRQNGSIFLARVSISAICDAVGEVTGYVGVCADITEKWDKEQLVRRMALYDGLTGLPNRSLLMERLGQLIAITARESRQIALMFLDLDGFKLINDTLGHEIGDQALKTVSTRLLSLIRTSDTVARLGGDEFVILLDNPESKESIAKVAARIIRDVNAPMRFDGDTTQVGVSIGIALFQNDGMSGSDLLKKADAAMYASKASGKNTFRFFDSNVA